MATIFAVYNLSGCIGRCDSKCHNATNPECKCICGGAFHGVGSLIAIEDRNTLTDDEILENAKIFKIAEPYRVLRDPVQMELFK